MFTKAYPKNPKHKWVVQMFSRDKYVGTMLNEQMRLVTDASFCTKDCYWRRMAKQTADHFARTLNAVREPHSIKRGIEFKSVKLTESK